MLGRPLDFCCCYDVFQSNRQLDIQELYPHHWPTFFSDILAVATCDAARASMFARVLLALDEDVISLEIPRSDAGSRRSMEFKDAMRERDMAAVMSTAMSVVLKYHNGNADTPSAMLFSLQRYVDWVDISLIVTPDFMLLLRQQLQGVPHSSIMPLGKMCCPG